MSERPHFLHSLGRSQVAAGVATVFDFGTLFLLVEVFHLWYVPATAIGAFMGAVANFLVNRHWSFQASHRPLQGQAGKYALVSAGSLILNVSGVWYLAGHWQVPYGFAKLITALCVALLYNFPLHRSFVFR